MQEDPKRSLFCLDWDAIGEDLSVWGAEKYEDFAYVDIVLVPC